MSILCTTPGKVAGTYWAGSEFLLTKTMESKLTWFLSLLCSSYVTLDRLAPLSENFIFYFYKILILKGWRLNKLIDKNI